MKARTALVACLTLLGGSAARAGDGVDITYAGGVLTIRCAEARLVDVLEQIGSATGTALVLDAAVKSTLVTATIEAEPVQTALEHLLEGRGVTYAMSLSADGQRVAQMYVGTDAEAKSIASAAAGRPRPPATDPASRRTPEPVGAPAHASISVPISEDDDDVEGIDEASFAGLTPESIPGLPSAALPVAGGASAPAPRPEQQPAAHVNQ
jgi:hypothetical protein